MMCRCNCTVVPFWLCSPFTLNNKCISTPTHITVTTGSYTTYIKVCHKMFSWLGRQQTKEGRLDCGVNFIISHLYAYRVGTAIEFLSTDIRVAVSLTLCSLCVWEMR